METAALSYGINTKYKHRKKKYRWTVESSKVVSTLRIIGIIDSGKYRISSEVSQVWLAQAGSGGGGTSGGLSPLL